MRGAWDTIPSRRWFFGRVIGGLVAALVGARATTEVQQDSNHVPWSLGHSATASRGGVWWNGAARRWQADPCHWDGTAYAPRTKWLKASLWAGVNQ